jgi:hypothetical protein
MTACELLGRFDPQKMVYVTVGPLGIPARITDARQVKGRVQYRISPLYPGTGYQWVNENQIIGR